MTPECVIQILRQALMTTFWLAAPLLAIGFIAGIVISLVQIATSIQDNAFSTIPRLVAFLAGLLFLLPWMLQRTMSYTIALFWRPQPLCPLTSPCPPVRCTDSCWCWRGWPASMVFVPLPGMKSAPEGVRAALALGFTLALFSQWPVVRTEGVTVPVLAGWALSEAAVGLAIGVAWPSPLKYLRWRPRCSACRRATPTPPPSTPTARPIPASCWCSRS